ncbi:alpha/beta fold hydrolase [Paenibacillus sp. CGMCC 1.16610]|uniref:Alpha/beta fold hydrolase n=1 Tax=Paenibacillus anseongense TaxID=2682845 RepID=A0ABW9UBW3_9BACL|nr:MULTISPECIES: alpha/beta hydrolase family protein [Paenibacillus]MBA2937685.1 alpha/beta fold hydrolase [Paenibacillus sp. CGMCC 1.16610]MVQ36743.1 alpha/beta fold hydrolase [Paenibacillus anseongense]
MKDYTKDLPDHRVKYIGENDLCIEIFEGDELPKGASKRPPLLFVHGAYTGSWMWSKYIPHFINKGWNCYVMNLRGHYKSRVLDLTNVTFEDYLEDMKEVFAECEVPPILIGFSMGGILSQKLAETNELAGLVVIDTSISKEVYEAVPYKEIAAMTTGVLMPAPSREENSSIDESADDIDFQRKYITVESLQAFNDFYFSLGANGGISIDSSLMVHPALVIKAINSEEDDRRGKATAEHLHAEYTGLWDTTHTGLLVGQRYMEVVDRIMLWLQGMYD